MEMFEFQDEIISIYRNCYTQLKESLKIIKDTYGSSEFIRGKDQPKIEIDLDTIIKNFDSFGDKLKIWSEVKQEIEHSNVSLSLDLRDFRLKLCAKNKSLEELKQVLSSQAIQIQNLKQDNEKCWRVFERLKIQIFCLKEYQNLFDTKQTKENKQISEQYCELSENLFTLGQVIEESDQFPNIDKQSHLDKEFIFEQEKELFNKEDNGIFDNRFYSLNPSIGIETICLKKLKTMYDENKSLKESVQNLQQITNRNMRDKAELEAKCLIYQKSVDQNNNMIDVFENLKRQLCEKLKASLENEKIKNTEIIQLMREMNEIKMHMLKLKQEKENLEGLTSKINENFLKMMNVQENLKKIVEQRDDIILKLNTEKERLMKENNILRKTEYDDKKTVRDLLMSMNSLQIQKQEMAASHYDELCRYNDTLQKLQQPDINVVSKSTEENKIPEQISTENLKRRLFEKTSLVSNLQKINGELTFKNITLEDLVLNEKKQRDQMETAVMHWINCIDPTLCCHSEFEALNNQDKIIFILERLQKSIKTTRLKVYQINRAYRKFISSAKIRFHQIEEHCGKIAVLCSRNNDLMNMLHTFGCPISLNKDVENVALNEIKQHEWKQNAHAHVPPSIDSHRILENTTRMTIYRTPEEESRNIVNFPVQLQKKTDKDVIMNLKKQNEDLLEKLHKLFCELKHLGNNYVKTSEEKIQLVNYNINLPHSMEANKEHSAILLKNNYSEGVELLRKDNKILRSHLQQYIKIVNELRGEKLSLQECVRCRDELLRKVFWVFKMKIQQAMQEVNEKFFLQRLCSDLKTALKIVLDQRKNHKGMVMNVYNEDYMLTKRKYTEKNVRDLLEKEENLSHLTDSFSDIQYYIDSMKKETSNLQSVLLSRLYFREN